MRVVLVRPSHPGNVGACARAMRVMGLSDLVLVDPPRGDPRAHADAIAFASGATALLAGASIVPALFDALADCQWSVAVSADAREFGPPPLPPSVQARSAIERWTDGRARRIAWVFGPERTGLSIADVQRCQALCSIPADPDYASLNLAQAVQVVAYCLRQASLAARAVPDAPADIGAATEVGGEAGQGAQRAPDDPALMADAARLEGFYAHLERALVAIGYLDPAHPKKLMPRLRRLFTRAGLRDEEVHLLRGVCKLMVEHGEGREAGREAGCDAGREPGYGDRSSR